MSQSSRGQDPDDDDRPRFDISWLRTPHSRGEPDSPGEGLVNPGPPQRGGGADAAEPQPEGEQELDDRLTRALAQMHESHIVDLAALLGVEFEDALRSALRLAARREIVIEKRDPIANDHLVARPAKARR